MTADLALYAPPTASDLEQSWQLAQRLCGTDFVPNNLRGKPEALLAVFLTGRELGIGPMQSLRDIYPVNGRPAMMATLMVSRVRVLGHQFKTLHSDEKSATVQIHRRGEAEPEPAVTFTLADAKQAGLDGKQIWRQYPKAMLWNRAASAACRRDASEALGAAVYTPEELDDQGPAATTVVEAGPAEVVGILADGWNSHDEQNEAHRRMTLYLAEHRLGAWFDRWLTANGYERPLSTSQMEEARHAVAGQMSGVGLRVDAPGDEASSPSPTPSGGGAGNAHAASGSPPDAKSPPSPTEPEVPPQADRSGAGGAHVDGTTQPDAGTPPSGVTAPPEQAAATPPGRRPSGGPKSPASSGAKGARQDKRQARGSVLPEPGESHGAAAGRPTTDEEEQALFEQGLSADDPRRHTR